MYPSSLWHTSKWNVSTGGFTDKFYEDFVKEIRNDINNITDVVEGVVVDNVSHNFEILSTRCIKIFSLPHVV